MSEEQGGAIAVRRATGVAKWQPQSFGEMVEYATFISKSELVPKEMRGKPADVLLAMDLGGELGMKPAQALQSICVINGRPSLWGDAMLGLVRKSGLLEQFDEEVEMAEDGLPIRAVCVVKRKGDDKVYIGEFTRAQAIKAGLWNRNVWASYPARMIKFRARSWALRDAFGDILKGLQSAEEMADVTEQDSFLPISGPSASDVMRQRLEIPTSIPETGGTRGADVTNVYRQVEPAPNGCTCHAPPGKPHMPKCPVALAGSPAAPAEEPKTADPPATATTGNRSDEIGQLVNTPGWGDVTAKDPDRMAIRISEITGVDVTTDRFKAMSPTEIEAVRKMIEHQHRQTEAAEAAQTKLL